MEPIAADPGRRGVVAVLLREDRFLVIRRSQKVVAPLAYCFPGGGIEPGESETQALVRELREELGLEVRPLRRVWQSVTPWQVDLAWWHCQAAGPESDGALKSIVANPAEVESVHWFSAEQMRHLPDLLESNHHFLAALAEGQIDLTPRE